MLQWEQHKRPVNREINVTLQQQVLKNGTFKYVAQHWCLAGEFQFVLTKEKDHQKFRKLR